VVRELGKLRRHAAVISQLRIPSLTPSQPIARHTSLLASDWPP
jgi:hypothetical protein